MSLSNKLFLSRSIILELLQDRGFDTEKYSTFTPQEIELMYKSVSTKTAELSVLDIQLTNKTKHKIVVKYVLSPRIRVSNIINVTGALLEDHLNEGDTLIIIIRDNLTSDEALEEYFKQIYSEHKVFCQYFWINALTFNLTQHEMVPKHDIIEEDEKQELIKNLQITDVDKLPSIKKNDPVAKYYGMKEGDICKITRKSETAGNYISYRLCQN
jgi:DNA-directed RNA polymerases I, II, and III subunit RPABC1